MVIFVHTTRSNPIFLIVQPQILPFDFGEESINAGDMVTAICSVNRGDFPLNITWFLNGKNVGTMESIQVFHTTKRTSQISIDSAQEEHSGEYSCVAHNRAGSSSYSANLLVNGIVCISVSSSVCFLLVQPQIHPFDFGEDPINSGDIVSVTCFVNKGDLPINITWYLNHKPIDTSEGISIFLTNKRSSQLSIENVQAVHSGEFTCEAANSAGKAIHSALLHVNGILSNCYSFAQTPSIYLRRRTLIPWRVYYRAVQRVSWRHARAIHLVS